MKNENKQMESSMYPSFFDLIDALGFSADSALSKSGRALPVAVNIAVKDDCYFVEASLPGCKKEDIKLLYDNKYFIINAARKLTPGFNRQTCEIPECSFVRKIFFEKDVNDEKIAASFSDGILSVILPFTDAKKVKKIEII